MTRTIKKMINLPTSAQDGKNLTQEEGRAAIVAEAQVRNWPPIVMTRELDSWNDRF
jgi:hypothetical protein